MAYKFRQQTLASILLLFLSAGCSGDGGRKRASEPEEFHADNDIAMTIRSVADAFRESAPLLAEDYAFEGVLTDGEGAPLYTDMTGSPGLWAVQVLDSASLRIHNLYLGDLLPDNLRQYLVLTLGLDMPIRIEAPQEAGGSEMTEYAIEAGLLRFESHTAKAANGVEGPLVNILLVANR